MEHYLFFDEDMKLGNAVQQLAGSARHISVVAPDEAYLKDLVAKASKNGFNIFTAVAEAGSEPDLRQAVQAAIREHGPADVTVSWIGGGANTAVAIVQALRDLAVFTEYYDVISGDADSSLQHVREGRLRSFENVWYRKIVLGKGAPEEAITKGIVAALNEKRDAYSVDA